MEAIHVHDGDADHSERAVVQRGRAVGRLVLDRERIAVEVDLDRLAAADVGVRLVGQRVDAGVRAEQAGQIEQVAVGRGDRVAARPREAAGVGGLGDADRGREPTRRRRRAVVERVGEVANPPSAAPSVVVSWSSHWAAWLSRIWMKLPAWKPSTLLDPR